MIRKVQFSIVLAATALSLAAVQPVAYDETGRRLKTLDATTVPLKDGRILMYIPTDEGRIWCSWSYDGGEKWLAPDRSSVASPLRPCRLLRLSSCDLALVWHDGDRPTVAISQDEGRLWFHRYALGIAASGDSFGLAEENGDIVVTCGSEMERVPLSKVYAMPGKPPEPRKPLPKYVQKRARPFVAADYETDRPDGRFEKTSAWAHDKLRRTTPVYSFDNVRTKEEMAAWKAGLRAKVRELMQLDDDEDYSKIEFRLVWSKPRDGYTLHRYEFYPEERLAVPFYMLVPDVAKVRKVPAALCYPGSGSSLESLAHEPDRFYTKYRDRNAQAWWYCRAGMIGVALENPATANNAADNMQFCRSQNDYYGVMGLMKGGLGVKGEIAREAYAVIEFLRRDGRTDMSRIVASGMSLGAGSALFPAVASDRITALVYNDFVCSGAQMTMAFTEGRDTLGGLVVASEMSGSYRWFDIQPDLQAAIAPRPAYFVEGGFECGNLDKIKRAYALAGAPENLRVGWHDKYRNPEDRPYWNVDLRRQTGLEASMVHRMANVDSAQHSFHPDRVIPWIQRVFGLDPLSPELERDIRRSAEEVRREYEEEPFR